MTIKVDVAIIGAGPAGIEASLAAAGAGMDVVLIEDGPRPGGQYYKQLPSKYASSGSTKTQKEGMQLLQRLADSDVRLLTHTLVWGCFAEPADENYLLTLYQKDPQDPDAPDSPYRLEAKTLVLATGAYDYPVPFPGWTLPGVITAGAGQIMVKSQRVRPGQRVLLSGSGPLQLALAAQLVQAGAEVVAVLESSFSFGTALRHAPAMWGQWKRMAEGWDYARTLVGAGVPYKLGWSVTEARGDGEVQEAVIARLDPNGKPQAGTEQTLKVDLVVTGFGLLPNTAAARLVGCKHEYKPEAGAYVALRDDTMQTSMPDVYVIGDAGIIGGAEMGQLEGKIAGIASAMRGGFMEENKARALLANLKPSLKRQKRFADFLQVAFAPGAGLPSLATEDTILCRCEEVTLGDVREAAAWGARSVTEIKAITRTGMGNCQGRICERLVARALADELAEEGATIESVGSYSVRPPLHPLPLFALAEATDKLDD
jgi:D-hydroxyproline dehydrogenase subunit alpha